jgi:hypothetical protein
MRGGGWECGSAHVLTFFPQPTAAITTSSRSTLVNARSREENLLESDSAKSDEAVEAEEEDEEGVEPPTASAEAGDPTDVARRVLTFMALGERKADASTPAASNPDGLSQRLTGGF